MAWFNGQSTAHIKGLLTHRLWVLLLVCAVLVIFAVGYSSEHNRITVRVIQPAYREMDATVAAQGTVLPINDFQARANFSGVVDEIYVRVGQKVHAGQMLVVVRDQYAASRVASAEANLQATEVSKENVERSGSQEDRIEFAADLVKAQDEDKAAAASLKTLKELESRGSASHAEVVAAEQRLKDADAGLRALKERTTSRYSATDLASWKRRLAAEKAALAAEKVSYANANIRSPISGTVYVIPVSHYDFVPMGAELLHVADLSKIYVRANFFEQDVAQLRQGQPVTIAWDGNPNRKWHGHIMVNPLALTRSGDLNVGQSSVAIDDAHEDLPINTNVTVTVLVTKHNHALTVPRQVLHREDNDPRQYVYCLRDGKLIKTPVNIGLVTSFDAEVTSGIQPHDVIAVSSVSHKPLAANVQAKAAD
jgi:HlyD family secretion protein